MKRDQLIAVIERADHIIRTLSNKYRDQKGALVFSSPYGQCKLTSDVKEILADFPEMIFESIDKKKAIEFIRTIKSLEGRKKDIHSAQSNQDISSIIVNITATSWYYIKKIGTLLDKITFPLVLRLKILRECQEQS